jgi:hypothetical protein
MLSLKVRQVVNLCYTLQKLLHSYFVTCHIDRIRYTHGLCGAHVSKWQVSAM